MRFYLKHAVKRRHLLYLALICVLLGFITTHIMRTPLEIQRTCNGCFNRQFKFILNNENICATSNIKIDILILVASAPHKTLTRKALRETWLTHSKHNTGKIRYAFLLGKSTKDVNMSKENEFYKDIVLGDFIDSYYNLTLKTMMGLRWAIKYCEQAAFVMKSDDDVYLNVNALLKALKKHEKDLQANVVGYSESMPRYPIRDNASEWYVSYDQYPARQYPRYSLGGPGYVTSMDVVRKIVAISVNIPFLPIEDIYIALCTDQIRPKIHHMRIKGFYAIDIYQNNHNPCLFRSDSVIAMHKIDYDVLLHLWNAPCH